MEKRHIINRNKLLNFIKILKGKVFNITWIKKDGSIRNANVRRHVKLFGSGPASPAHQFNSSHLLVYLMPRMQGNTFIYERGWRLINLDTVAQLTTKGKTYEITPEAITTYIDLSETDHESPTNLYQLQDEITALTV